MAPAKSYSTSAKEKERWVLRLYVAGRTARCEAAERNLRKVCDEHVPGRYEIEVVDLLENPALAHGEQILAVPTLVRRLPQPVRRIIGDLSNTDRVLVGLDLKPSRVAA
jgi:circadian clock protein KaiB